MKVVQCANPLEAAAILRQERESRGILQKDIAQAIQIGECAYQRVESGKRATAPETLIRIADALGLRLVIASCQRPDDDTIVEILQQSAQTGQSLNDVARRTGVSREYLQRLIKRRGLTWTMTRTVQASKANAARINAEVIERELKALVVHRDPTMRFDALYRPHYQLFPVYDTHGQHKRGPRGGLLYRRAVYDEDPQAVTDYGTPWHEMPAVQVGIGGSAAAMCADAV